MRKREEAAAGEQLQRGCFSFDLMGQTHMRRGEDGVFNEGTCFFLLIGPTQMQKGKKWESNHGEISPAFMAQAHLSTIYEEDDVLMLVGPDQFIVSSIKQWTLEEIFCNCLITNPCTTTLRTRWIFWGEILIGLASN